MTRNCNDIRREFVEFFEQRGHTYVPSSSLLPAEDPTLLFTNAGMNQFKEIFLGREKRSYMRAVNSQKCIRAGGKHNDLEDVGHDTYHHTFFEMLGNWSFGDYFKKDAISWAWELLTKVWGLPKERLHATVFGGDKAEGLAADDEAADLWRTITDIDHSHIHYGNKKDNFWEMGETGPCGPCSEIHIDLTPDLSGSKLVNAGDRRVMEIWNLVFMQFNRDEAGKLSPLPAKHVDTGMGLERVGMVLQAKQSNYATDLFVPIIEKIETLTSHRYGAEAQQAGKCASRFDTVETDNLADVAMRVIADHARSLSFAIADGVIPSNEGRGYVLRRILRRAARYGRQYLGIDGPFVVKLVPTIAKLMGDSFPEIAARQKYVEDTIREEEISFGKTLDRGIELFHRAAETALEVDKISKPEARKRWIRGEVAFELYATFGFPIDLTQLMAKERGLDIDMAGYEEAMRLHKELSRTQSGNIFKSAAALVGLPATDDSAKYLHSPTEAKVLGFVVEQISRVEYVTNTKLPTKMEAAIVLDETNFYGDQGGQVGDIGYIEFRDGRFKVTDTTLAGQCVLHWGIVEQGTLETDELVKCVPDTSARLDTMRNHTATHLLNWALREVLGAHINQAGSVVGPDRLRFDFTHNHAVKAEELAKVEQLVNERIIANEIVGVNVMPLAEARKIPCVRAVFGEKYPDPVRVISIGTADPVKEATQTTPVEFCGGTHLNQTGMIGFFKIVAEESVAKGVRRISAVTGRGSIAYVQHQDTILGELGLALRTAVDELPVRVAAMQKEIKELKKRPAGGAVSPGQGEFETVGVFETPAGKVLIASVGSADAEIMRTLCDVQRQKGHVAIFVGGADEEKVTLVAMVDDTLAKSGKIKAGDWVKAIAPVVDGGGGGKPTLAQAGGKKPEKLADALAAAAEWAKQKMA